MPEDDRSNPTRRAGQALSAYLKSAGLLDQSREGLCMLLWPQVAGEWYARHTYVTSVRGDTVYIRCESDSPRANQLHLDSEAIIKRLNAALGESVIREIRPSSAGIGRDIEEVKMPASEGPPVPSAEELAEIRVPPEQIQEILELAADLEGEMAHRLESLLLAQAKVDIWRSRHGYFQCPGCGAWHLDREGYCLSCHPPDRPTNAGGDEGLSAFFDAD
ncbi:MAG: DUF721 domain-containing protein [Armatimonadota bacterium]